MVENEQRSSHLTFDQSIQLADANGLNRLLYFCRLREFSALVLGLAGDAGFLGSIAAERMLGLSELAAFSVLTASTLAIMGSMYGIGTYGSAANTVLNEARGRNLVIEGLCCLNL